MAWWAVVLAATFVTIGIAFVTLRLARVFYAVEVGSAGVRGFGRRYTRSAEPGRFWGLVVLEIIGAIVGFAPVAIVLSLLLR